ncbi:MAG: glycosyltransferase family 2 protein [Pseudomonadota bacterium]
MTRVFDSLAAFRRSGKAALASGPAALLIAEDAVELGSTLAHLAERGFRSIAVFAPDTVPLPDPPRPLPARPALRLARIRMDTRPADTLTEVVNAAIETAPPGTWLHACYNAEYLMYPFCESRSVGEMLSFHAEERREALLGFVVDLYAADLAQTPSGVDRAAPYLDRIGYYALARAQPDPPNAPRERQLDFYGGLRWRFEEHTHPARRRIDRIALFRTRPGLRLLPDGTLNVPEMNTYACAWHHSLTAAICSFRAAKALRSNSVSRGEIESFLWTGSTPFTWTSTQLMELGLMEPGQWM